ncbi:MAG: pilus assembly protein PilM [Patescibacteria group bacterium]
MAFFSATKKQTFLGVDIGVSGIKIVELGTIKGRPLLHTYGYSERDPQLQGESPFDNPKKTGLLLAKICKDAGTFSTQAMAALPISNVFSTIVAVPKTRDKKLMKQQIDSQVSKLAPMPIGEMITYSTFVDQPEEEKPTQTPNKTAPQSEQAQTKHDPNKSKKKDYARVLVTGSAKTLVQKYVEIFKTAKLQLQAIDTEAFALIRALIGKDKGTILLVDIGFERTSLTVVDKGIPFLTRSMNIGGSYVTKKIVDQMNVPQDEAEQIKIDLARSQKDISTIVDPFMQPIIHEIRYTLQLFANMEYTDSAKVEKIIVTGGSSGLPMVPEMISHALDLSVYRGDPWARVAYPENLKSVLEEVGSRMSIAVGLAMRDL